MQNKRITGWITLLMGLLITGMALYVYFVAHTIYPHSDSTRVQDFNRLLRIFGRTGTALMLGLIGLGFVWSGGRIIKKHKG